LNIIFVEIENTITMKRHLFALFIAVLLLPALLSAQEEIIMGPGYALDVYFELGAGVSEEVERAGWDLGFFTTPESAAIITNGSMGVELRTYMNGDTTAWKDVDTTGLSTWKALYNGEDSWENGAFNRLSTGGNDVGWGIRNASTNDIIGDSLYIIKLADESYKQLWIERKIFAENKYEIKWADLDGTNVGSETLDIDNFLGVNFVYFDFASEDLSDREPESTEWDILFTQAMVLLPQGVYFPVVSVFHNTNSPANRFHPVPLDFNDWFTQPLEYKKSVIGGDWKWFDLTGFQWNIVDSLVFFTEALDGNIYKIYFTDYEGTSTGYIAFEAEVVSMVDVDEAADEDISFLISPNPAQNDLRITLKDQDAGQYEIKLFDMSGRQVLYKKTEGQQDEILLDISSLAEGMYVVSVFLNNKIATEKLIVK
jgi:hypothetical protein